MGGEAERKSGNTTRHAEAAAAQLDDTYRRYWQKLCRFVRAEFGPGPPDPEDIAQAAFARYAALRGATVVAQPEAFLKATARNLALDAYRHNARTAVVLREIGIVENSGYELSPEDVLKSREELIQLNAVLQRLKPKQRAALLMHRVDGLSYAEIGRRLDMSAAGARKLVEKAFADCSAMVRREERKR